MDTLSPQEREALQRLFRALRHFRAMMGPTVPTQVVQAFLAVALEEDKPLHEYADPGFPPNLLDTMRRDAGLAVPPTAVTASC